MVILSRDSTQGANGIDASEQHPPPAGSSQQFPQGLHPRVHAGLRAGTGALVQVCAAARAEPSTVLVAERLNGQAEQDVFAQEVIRVDPPLLEIGDIQLVIGELALLLWEASRASLAVQVESVADPGLKRLQASAADQGNIAVERSADQHPATGPTHVQLGLDNGWPAPVSAGSPRSSVSFASAMSSPSGGICETSISIFRCSSARLAKKRA